MGIMFLLSLFLYDSTEVVTILSSNFTDAPKLFVSILIREETDQVNMEHFGFSFLHELAARNLFKILIATLDQIVFMQVQAAN